MIAGWGLLIVGILTLVVGLIIGFLISKKLFTSQLKKNPPINAGMIRAMYNKMGRKPSEVQVRSVISAMKKYQK